MKSEDEYENILTEIWNKYIAPAYSNPTSKQYYVDDIANCENDEVEYIILCESPHTEEVEHKDHDGNPKPIPLVGNSGKSVSSFLFEDNTPIGELVVNKSKIISYKLAIVNVCNIPLQEIDQNKDYIKGLNLNYLRENCKVIKALRDDLKERITKYENAHTIVVCGEFAKAYFKEVKNIFPNIKALYVPHPSRNHWQFIYEHKDDILTLKMLFNPNI